MSKYNVDTYEDFIEETGIQLISTNVDIRAGVATASFRAPTHEPLKVYLSWWVESLGTIKVVIKKVGGALGADYLVFVKEGSPSEVFQEAYEYLVYRKTID